MKKLLCVVLLLTGMSFGQSVVSEAKAKIEKEHHAAMVSKAQSLLETKAALEAELKEVDAKLAKLEAGQDVKLKEDSGTLVWSGASGGTWTTTTCCCCYTTSAGR
jgi:hypothetical protein